jgi:hypothetical protein
MLSLSLPGVAQFSFGGDAVMRRFRMVIPRKAGAMTAVAYNISRWSSLCLTFSLLGMAKAQDLPAGPLPETPQSNIGYRTVADALASLKARNGVTVSIVREWTIVVDEANKEVWSFAPPSHPAYPAVVRRAVRSRSEGGSEINMSVLCEAAKEPCDNLVREFNAMNKRI